MTKGTIPNGKKKEPLTQFETPWKLKGMKYRRDIDGLRAIAVLAVVFFHTGFGFTGGYVGVDIFFVISGYIITSIILIEKDAGTFSLLNFYERRIRRILPPFLMMTLIVFFVSYILMLPLDFRKLALSLIAAIMFSSNIWFFREGQYFEEPAKLEPLLHTWSLGVELQFYIFFPVILIFCIYAFRTLGSLLAVSIIALLSLLLFLDLSTTKPEAAFYLTHLRAWELLCGAILAIGMHFSEGRVGNTSMRIANFAATLGIVLILTPIFLYDNETIFPGISALPPVIGAVLVIGSGSESRTFVSKLLSSPPMVFVGRMSYSLYLWHWPVISFIFYTHSDPSVALRVIGLAFSLLAAFLSRELIEVPISNRKRFGASATVVSSASIAAFLLGLGVSVWQSDGFPNRINPDILAMSNQVNYLHDRRDCHFVNADRARAGDICIRGASDIDPSFVLVGDSHADAISPAVFTAAQELGLSGYQYSSPGFLPLPGVWQSDSSMSSDVDAFVVFLEERPNIDSIIITRFWQHQVTGYSYRHSRTVWYDENYDGSGPNYNRRALVGGLERLSNHFPQRNFILLDDIPTGWDLHIQSYLRLLNLESFDGLGITREEYEAQRATYEPTLRGASQRISNLYYIPIFDEICNNRFCPLFEDEVLLYRDGDHLSWEGALKLTPVARSMFLSLETIDGE